MRRRSSGPTARPSVRPGGRSRAASGGSCGRALGEGQDAAPRDEDREGPDEEAADEERELRDDAFLCRGLRGERVREEEQRDGGVERGPDDSERGAGTGGAPSGELDA